MNRTLQNRTSKEQSTARKVLLCSPSPFSISFVLCSMHVGRVFVGTLGGKERPIRIVRDEDSSAVARWWPRWGKRRKDDGFQFIHFTCTSCNHLKQLATIPKLRIKAGASSPVVFVSARNSSSKASRSHRRLTIPSPRLIKRCMGLAAPGQHGHTSHKDASTFSWNPSCGKRISISIE